MNLQIEDLDQDGDNYLSFDAAIKRLPAYQMMHGMLPFQGM